MLTKRIRLSLPSDGQNLTLIRKLIEKFLEGTPFQSRSFEVRIVISEASSNVIRHAYDEKATSSLITIHGYLNPFYLRISVKDTGKGLMAFEKKREYPGDGGYGIEMMRKLSDRFSYRTAPGLGTTVDVLFYRPLVPAVLRRPEIAFVAAAASILASSMLWSVSLSAPPGSPFNAFRETAEKLVLELPIADANKADFNIDFLNDHLDDYDRLYREGKFGLLKKSIESAPYHVSLLNRELLNIPAAERQRLNWKIKRLNKKAMEIAGMRDRRGPFGSGLPKADPLTTNIITEVASATSEMMAERAIGGERI